MGTLLAKIDALAREHLRDGWTNLEVLWNGRVAGAVVSPDFDDVSMLDRRYKFKAIYEAHLTEEELKDVSTLLYYTPEEWDMPLEFDEQEDRITMQTRTQTWGDDLAVRIPRELAAKHGLRDGQEVEIYSEDDRILIRIAPNTKRYASGELVEQTAPENRHEEIEL